MKNYRFFTGTTFFAALLLAACHTHKKIELEFPKAMLPHVRLETEKRCRQGETLYKLNCAGCHNVTRKRKILIPDFNPDELKGYALRVANARHEQNMPDSLVSEEDLAIIMTFLNYKKKNEPLVPRQKAR